MGALSGASVLVTGATGFVGAHLVERLRNEHLSRLALLSRRPIHHVGDGQVAIASDLADLSPSTWGDAGLDAFDVVFHLGAATQRSRTGRLDGEAVLRTNVVGTHALLQSLSGSTRCRVVFASAVDVFASSEKVIDESSPVRDTGLYPMSKLMGEALVADWADRTGSQAIIARVGHVYGPGEGAYGKAVPTFIQAALDGRPLVVYGDGSAERDLLYVADAVEALVRASLVPLAEPSTTVIVAGAGSTPIAEIARQVAEMAGRPELVKFERDRPAGHSTRFNIEKMRRLLGDWDRVSLRGGLRNEMEHFKGAMARS